MKHSRTQNTFFIGVLAVTTLAFLWLVRDFLQPLFWAAVLATLFNGVQKRYEAWMGGRAALAAVATLLTILLIVVAPLLLVIGAAATEAASIYERIADGGLDIQGLVDRVETYVPLISQYAEQAGSSLDEVKQNLSSMAVNVSRFVASQALVVGQGAARFTLLLFLMLYVLFFFLRDGSKLLRVIMDVLPLGDDREERLLTKFAEVSRATIKGTLVVAIVQGGLGGLLFWVLGLSAPIFWGSVMTLLSLLPAIGTVLVWLPAAIYLISIGSVVKGVILIGAGTAVIGLVDNILRPLLVGRDTKMPDFLILLSTLGGLAAFGLSGFVIGPIIAAFFLAVWQMFGEVFAQDPTTDDGPAMQVASSGETVPVTAPEPADAASATESEPSPEASS